MFDNNDDLEQKIREMAKLTILSDKISPIQEKNLKMYPLVFFNGVKSVKINYDLSHMKTDEDAPAKSNSFVSYHLAIDESADNSKLEVRFEHLERSVRNLFWNDLTVRVFFNEKKVMESKYV